MKNRILTIPEIKALPKKVRDNIMTTNISRKGFNPGQEIYTKDDPSTGIYLVESGEVRIYENGDLKKTATKMQYFGEESFHDSNKKDLSAMAYKKSIVRKIPARVKRYHIPDGIQKVDFDQLHEPVTSTSESILDFQMNFPSPKFTSSTSKRTSDTIEVPGFQENNQQPTELVPEHVEIVNGCDYQFDSKDIFNGNSGKINAL